MDKSGSRDPSPKDPSSACRSVVTEGVGAPSSKTEGRTKCLEHAVVVAIVAKSVTNGNSDEKDEPDP